MVFLGLRTTIYPAPDLMRSKRWFIALLDAEPYFDEEFYVGFNVGGYELGLDPDADPERGARSYWGVDDAEDAAEELLAAGCEEESPVNEVGDGIKVGTYISPQGDLIGIIENPHFEPQD